MKDEYTRDELERLAQVPPRADVLGPAGVRASYRGVDRPGLGEPTVGLPDASELMREFAAILDADPYFEGWRSA